MKTLMTKRRLLASFLSIVMLLSVLLSGAVFTRAESTNLREHIEEVKGIARPVGDDWWRQSAGKDSGNLLTDEDAATLFDGDITNQVFIRSALDWENPLESGVYVKLDQPYYVEKIVLHSGAVGYPETLSVYATTENKIFPPNGALSSMLVAEGIACENHREPVTVEIGMELQYLAIFSTSGEWRPYEIEIHQKGDGQTPDEGGDEPEQSGDEPAGSTMLTGSAIASVKAFATPVGNDWWRQDPGDLLSDADAASLFDGNYENQVYVRSALDWETPLNTGVLIELDKAYDIGKLVLYSGYPGYPDKVNIYADTRNGIYPPDDCGMSSILVAENVECKDSSQPVTVDLKGINAQYLAIVTASGEWRPYEIEIHQGAGGEGDIYPDTPTPDNPNPDTPEPDDEKPASLLTGSAIAGVNAFATPVGNDWWRQEPGDLLSDADAATLFDGNYENQVYVRSALDWETPLNTGVLVKLDKAYNIGKLVLYSGYPGYPDKVNIYADTRNGIYPPDDCGMSSILVAENVECKDSSQPVTVDLKGINAQYLAIVTVSGEWRPYEIEIHQGAGGEGGTTPDNPTPDNPNPDNPNPDTPDNPEPDDEKPASLLTGSAIAGVNAFATPVGNDWWRQEPGDLLSDADAATLFDGNYENQVFVRSALDWETPLNTGVLVKLDKAYNIGKIVLYSGYPGYPDKINIYATTREGIYPADNLPMSEILVAKNVECKDSSQPVTVDLQGVNAQYLAFVTASGEWRPYEIEIHQGAGGEGDIYPDTPDAPTPDNPDDPTPDNPPSDNKGNILLGLGEPNKIGVTTGTDYDAAGSTGGNLDNLGLNDGIIIDPETGGKQDAQFWGGKDEGSKFIFVYDLGKNYDLSKVAVFAKDNYQDEEVNQGIKSWDFYASATRGDLFQDANKVAGKKGYDDPADVSVDVSIKGARYVALVVAIEDTRYGACRISEWEVYGTLSAEQGEGGGPVITPDGHENLLTNMAPDLFGVTAGNDYETLDGTDGPHGFEGLTDGLFEEEDDNGNIIEQNVQFWNGKSEDGTLKKFVFTYDLVKNYDLSKVAVFAWENYQDEGVNQGIESWTLYASRTREDLFKNESKITGKNGYADPADLELALSLKQIRFVSFVFTIQDTRYGACRLTELELYGVESAEQDSDKPVEALPEYRDFVTESGAVIRILALDETDNLSKLDVKAAVKKITTAADLRAVEEKLDNRYYAKVLYQISLTDANGDDMDLGDRVVRLLMPVNSANYLVAVVDVIGVDLINAKYVDGHMMIDAVNNNTYALITTSGEAGGSDDTDSDNTGSDDSNTGNSGSDDNTSDSPATGVTGVAGVVLLAVLAAAVMVYTKKAKRA